VTGRNSDARERGGRESGSSRRITQGRQILASMRKDRGQGGRRDRQRKKKGVEERGREDEMRVWARAMRLGELWIISKTAELGR